MVVSVSVNNLDTRDCISRLSDREGQHARSYAMGPHPLYRCTITRTYWSAFTSSRSVKAVRASLRYGGCAEGGRAAADEEGV